MILTQRQSGYLTNLPATPQGSQAPRTSLHGRLQLHSLQMALCFLSQPAKTHPLLVPPLSFILESALRLRAIRYNLWSFLEGDSSSQFFTTPGAALLQMSHPVVQQPPHKKKKEERS